jgi:TIR domain-containing protein
MPYLPSFQHDAFVSYAQGPKALNGYGGGRGDFISSWTRAFVDDLGSHLDVLLGTKDPARRAQIWMDPALEGNQPLSDSLRTKIQSSALLIVVMSPLYLRSQWCGDELRWFTEKYRDHQGRVFVVRAFQTDETQWPDALRPDGNPLKGYPFQSSDDPGSFPLGWPQSDRGDHSYWSELQRLAREVAAQLKTLEYIDREAPDRTGSTDGAKVTVPKIVGRSVFLGYMHDSLQDMRGELRTRLDKLGLQVVPPEQDDPVDEASLRTSLEQYAKSADAVVLVANENCELWPKGQVGGAVNLQLQFAQDHKRSVCFWLRAADLAAIKSASYRTFLSDRKAKASSEPNDPIAWQSIEEFVKHIHAKLNRAENLVAEQLADAFVCSNMKTGHPVYEQFTKLVISSIRETERGAIVADREETGQIRLTTLEKDIARADSLVVVCFDQDWEWANSIILQLKQVVGTCRNKIKLLVTGPEHKNRGEYYGPFKFTTLAGVGPDNVVREQVLRDQIISAFQSR